jgi:hypothetical protein
LGVGITVDINEEDRSTSVSPSSKPSPSPPIAPSGSPIRVTSASPTVSPGPSTQPSSRPSVQPSTAPSDSPSTEPSFEPSLAPSSPSAPTPMLSTSLRRLAIMVETTFLKFTTFLCDRPRVLQGHRLGYPPHIQKNACRNDKREPFCCKC